MKRFPCPPIFAVFLWAVLLGPVHAQTYLPDDHPKVQTTRRVFAELVQAIGDGRPPPALRLQPAGARSSLVASLFPRRHELVLGERAFDLCAAQGPDSLAALAFLLGHELAHYYRGHGWTGDFGQRFAELDVGRTHHLFDAVRQVELETEADYFGGFAGHLAGYRSLDAASPLLESIYTTYGLEADLEGYPTLAERQQIARRATADLDQLIPIFAAGRRLLLLQQYSAAFRCFVHIAQTFPSREILNNAGLARALEAVDLFDSGKLRFIYPLELDGRTRLVSGGKAADPGLLEDELLDDGLRYQLLEEAAEWFERARQKDRDYALAYINQACAADLLDEPEEALMWAGRACKITARRNQPLARAHALLIRGIARTRGEAADLDAARRDFEAARAAAPDLAALNLAILERTASAWTSRPLARPALLSSLEQIDGRDPENYADLLSEARIVSLPGGGPTAAALTVYAHQTPVRESLVIDTGASIVAVLATGPEYAGQTGRGLSVGMDRARMLEAYGRPAYLIVGPQGTYHAYPDARLVFHTDGAGQIQGWMLYHIQN